MAGRPTKYNEGLIQKVSDYLATTGKEQMSLPTIEGLSLYLGVDDDTLVEWGKKYPTFSAALSKVKKFQKLQLINDGIYGGKEVNSTIVKLLLQNNHGMREKSDVTSDNKPLPAPIYGGRSVETE